MAFWLTGGYGRGELRINDAAVAETQTSPPTLLTAAALASGTVSLGEAPAGGSTTTLGLKGEGILARIMVAGGGLIAQQTVDAHRLRVALEIAHEQLIAEGRRLTPVVEVALRHDGGHGPNGFGVEIGGDLKYLDPADGVTMAGRGRLLAALPGQGTSHREWGLSLLLRMEPQAGGRGLSLSLLPAYGHPASGVQQLWQQGVAEQALGDPGIFSPQARLEAELGYGLALPAAGGAVLTPYGGLTLAEAGAQSYRLGGRLTATPALHLSLEGERRVAADGAPDHGLSLQARLRF